MGRHSEGIEWVYSTSLTVSHKQLWYKWAQDGCPDTEFTVQCNNLQYQYAKRTTVYLMCFVIAQCKENGSLCYLTLRSRHRRPQSLDLGLDRYGPKTSGDTHVRLENEAWKCKDRNKKSPEQSPQHLEDGKLNLSLGFLTKSINCEPLLTVWDTTQFCSPFYEFLCILCFPQDLCASFYASQLPTIMIKLSFIEVQAPVYSHLDCHSRVHSWRFVGLTVS